MRAGAPDVDVVFVHGIRGGPFASWVHLDPRAPAPARRLTHEACWPAAWLAADVPGARLLSLQYAGEPDQSGTEVEEAASCKAPDAQCLLAGRLAGCGRACRQAAVPAVRWWVSLVGVVGLYGNYWMWLQLKVPVGPSSRLMSMHA